MSNKPKKSRRHFSPAEKVAILRKHLIEKIPVSDICDQHQMHPTLFYLWQKTFFEQGAAAFENKKRKAADPRDKKIELLQAKLAQKNEVVAELLQEHIQLKKEFGEL